MNRAIFLDRDGTIIEERGYICHLSESEIFPFAFEAVRQMNQHHFKVIGITNQSAIARAICTQEQVETMHAEIREAFLQRQAVIETFYYCPYHADGVVEEFKKNHPWRKPSPGMLLQAAVDYNIDLLESYMMGDDTIDIQAGKNAGCKTVLVLTGKGRQTREKLKQNRISPDLTAENILIAFNKIIAL
ncbi:MAG: HAD-IIIA family hydrolase [Candidatus Aminicenantes bacterium]|nr:HAD-IIIA family hydrolase [Candidatus Aminicenantes bacterium]NIM83761.1 HAD-IIIA family hydrolase [Candidatus Aminicenantes bacterium]NIN23221.1 HAD-IIIA family hydrolase [Candidatus Aminicenantes bacterium]NIN46915.1 HAD-IIIA family hydrolase [Candidatus Aminicenantes bacterium]NIN89837.1 HAD-IIIA family hydrolase [Candidatus Aminicenantes bacterium]